MNDLSKDIDWFNALKKEVVYLKTIIKHQDLIIRELQEKTRWLQEKKKCNKCEVTKNSNQNIHTTTANTHLEIKDKAGALAVSKVPATETNSRESETETKTKQYITRKEVSAAVEEVKTLSVIGNIQNLHKEEIYCNVNELNLV
ncbi:hypothetical protein JTB14_031717 [Gonioctena quinquepunctata]|nr:hypothetical protein JTB14_031717 [Gonioctena quinquepunctata]